MLNAMQFKVKGTIFEVFAKKKMSIVYLFNALMFQIFFKQYLFMSRMQ